VSTGELTTFLEQLQADRFAFPSAEMIDAAAAMFPTARDTAIVQGWHGMVGNGVSSVKRGPDGKLVRHVRVNAGYGENKENAEGARARIEIAPGLVRIARRDEAKAERTRERLRLAELEVRAHETRVREYEAEQLHRPMVFADLEPALSGAPSRGTRGIISAWSAKSRANMVASICELNLAPILSGDVLPCMTTLTLPGDWLAVAPDAATAARLFDNWRKAYEDKWGVKLVCIWKREFQKRGAPHWHLWMVPPVPMYRMKEYSSWLSLSWTRVLFGAELTATAEFHAALSENGKCACSEVCRSLGAGTGVDFKEGLRARDPKRLAVYFLKESLGGEGKAYQNAAPVEWEGQSIGRFWGYKGLDKAIATVPLDPNIDVQLVRVLRRWQRSKRITREVTVWGTRERDYKKRQALRASGEVVPRMVRVPARPIGSAGWVAANSGADLATYLARYATLLTEWRDAE